MNEQKLNRLFGAARRESPPSPETGFENLVMSAIRGEQRSCATEPVSLRDQLGALLPHLAWAAVLVVGLSVAADFGLAALGVPNLTDGVVQLSEQWLFTANGF